MRYLGVCLEGLKRTADNLSGFSVCRRDLSGGNPGASTALLFRSGRRCKRVLSVAVDQRPRSSVPAGQSVGLSEPQSDPACVCVCSCTALARSSCLTPCSICTPAQRDVWSSGGSYGPTGSVRRRAELLEQLSDWQLLKKYSSAYS